MSVSKKMTGTSWHTERVHRADGDARRYKGRCKYYKYESDICEKSAGICTGSAHCKYYRAITEEEFRARQKNQADKKKPKEDDCYWY